MKLTGKIFLALMTVSLCSCAVSDWSDKKVEEWCMHAPMYTELNAKPDAGIDKRQLVEQYIENKAEWDAAIAFLKRDDLAGLEDGRYDITSSGTYANVQRYHTKDSSVFEIHRKYIDIQYIVKGNEIVEVAKLPELKNVISEYDFAKDIAFYEEAALSYNEFIDEGTYTILFPSDAHKPCISNGKGADVMKIVVKIPFVKLD